MSFIVWGIEPAEEDGEWEELEWTRIHEAGHAEVAKSLGYGARAHVNANGDGGGWTEVW